MADIDLKIGATTDELDKGTAAAQAKLKEMQANVDAVSSSFTNFGDSAKAATDNAKSGLDDLAKTFEKLNESIGKSGEGGASTLVDVFAKASSALGPVGKGIALIAGAIGGAAFGAQKFEESLAGIGDKADRIGVSAERFQNMRQAFELGGIKAKEFDKDIVKISDELRDLNWDKDGQFKRQLDEFGIKARTLPGYFDEVAAKLKKAADEGGGPLVAKVAEATKVGDELAKVLSKGPEELKKLETAAAAAGATIKNDVIKQAQANVDAWKQSFGEIELAIEGWLAAMGLAIIAWARKIKPAIVDAFTGWMRGAQENYEDTISKMESSNKFAESFGANFGDQASSAVDKLKAKFGGLKDAVTVTDDKIKDIPNNLAKIADNWKFVDKGGKDKFDTAGLHELQTELDAVRAKYDELKLKETEAVTSFQHTEAQKVAILRAALAERRLEEIAIFDKEIALAGDNAAKRTAIERQKQKALETLDKDGEKITEEALKKNVQEWQSSIQGIVGAFNSQLSGLLSKTETWGQAMAKIGQQIVMKLIEEFEKLAIIQPLIKMLTGAGVASPQSFLGGLFSGGAGAAGGAAAQAAQTANTAALTANTAASVSGTTALATSDAVTATNTVAQGSNTLSVVANTVATQFNTIAESIKSFLPSFDVGTNYVPQTGLAMVHEGEAIIPAGYNTSGLGGGGGVTAGANLTFNVNALDSANVLAFFNRNGPAIARVLSAHMNLNPSFGT